MASEMKVVCEFKNARVVESVSKKGNTYKALQVYVEDRKEWVLLSFISSEAELTLYRLGLLRG